MKRPACASIWDRLEFANLQYLHWELYSNPKWQARGFGHRSNNKERTTSSLRRSCKMHLEWVIAQNHSMNYGWWCFILNCICVFTLTTLFEQYSTANILSFLKNVIFARVVFYFKIWFSKSIFNLKEITSNIKKGFC